MPIKKVELIDNPSITVTLWLPHWSNDNVLSVKVTPTQEVLDKASI